MKQVIPFKKDIIFKTKISDITSISLEHTLSFEDDCISGDFILSGDYKMTEASVNKEDFYYKLPFDIALDSRYDTSKLKIEIEDFYYEIINSDVLRVNIEVSIDGLEEKNIIDEFSKETNKKEEPTILDIKDEFFNLEKDIDSLQEELVRNHEHLNKSNEVIIDEKIDDSENEIQIQEANINNILNDLNENQNNIGSDEIIMEQKTNVDTNEIKSLFNNLDNEDTFSTYHVYILRSEDTIESVMAKYNINKDTLSQYNDIENLKLGDKIIIPALIND